MCSPSARYTQQPPSSTGSRLTTQERHSSHRACGNLVWYAWLTPICYRQSALITNEGGLIPECNGLSQFKEDTGKPSVQLTYDSHVARSTEL